MEDDSSLESFFLGLLENETEKQIIKLITKNYSLEKCLAILLDIKGE